MNIKIVPRLSRNKEKLYYTVSWGMDAGQRIATGIFTFTHPINSLQQKHNKEALHFLEIKRSQLSLDRQAIGTAVLPAHRLKANFLDFYEDFVTSNRQIGNRHLEGSLPHLKSFTPIIFQEKTKGDHFITLHPIAKSILEKRKAKQFSPAHGGRIFYLPTADGANKLLGRWCESAGIEKHITWNCARLSFSVLLQDANVNAATIALMLGHTSTKYVNETYKRYRPKDPSQELSKLPVPTELPF